MKVDTKDHMVSIPLKQYNEIVSKIESDDLLAKNFQDFIQKIGERLVNVDNKISIQDMREILKSQGIEFTTNIGERGRTILQVRMIQKEKDERIS